jgi:beta-1,4-mannosyltransferase
MKIIFIPDYRDGNPYQQILSKSLVKEGVDVYFGNFVGLFSILKLVKKFWKPDILHIHWPHPFLIADNKSKTLLRSTIFICELLILRAINIKIIWTIHNISNHEDKFSSEELFFNRLLIKLCNKLIAHCSSAKSEVIKIYNTKESSIVVIPHGNYIGWYKNAITRSRARKELNLSEKDVIFLYFGQIRPYKGVLELIIDFKKLNHQQAKLLIVGKPLNDDVAADILNECNESEKIKNIFEFIPDDDLQIYMNAADVVVLPYRNILTSGAVISAISFGKPIIAPAIGCIGDILDEKGSFLYSTTNDGLLKAMECALDTNNLISFGKYNLELAKKLRWNEIGKKTYHIYQNVLDNKREDDVKI